MQVYKAYFKIIRKRLPSILIYFSIFLLMSLIITSILGNTGSGAFTETRNKIALFNDEPGSPIADGLKEFLAKNEDIVNIPDDKQSTQDALFYGNIVYSLRIPAGFTQSFLSGSKDVMLEKTAASGSTSSIYLDLLVDRYLSIAQLYIKNAPDSTASQIASNVSHDLASQADVVVNAPQNASDTNTMTYYFQYLAYALMAVMIMGVTSFMMAFNDKDLSNRNQCSPMRPSSMNLQIILGNATFALAVWAVQCSMVFLFHGNVTFGMGTVLLVLNALALTIVSLSIGFLAGKFVRNPGVQSAVTNVVSLGTSFISGVFVDQALLGKTVLNIARFTPGYWYVRAVNDIRNTVTFSLQNVQPVLYGMLIQLGFAVTIFIVALVLSKQIKLQREI
jgi:ABC-2 type transport system permease protein